MTVIVMRPGDTHHVIGEGVSVVQARAGGGAFDPLTLSPVLWLDASDTSTLFQDEAGTTPVASDGDVVGRWADKSASGYHTTQTTTAAKPLHKTGIQNGLPVVRFDGAGDNLPVVSSDASSHPLKFPTGSFSIMAVIRPASLPLLSIFFGARRFASGWFAGFNNAAPAMRLYSFGELWQPFPMSSITATTTPQLFYASAPRGGTGQYYKNGALLQSTTSPVGVASLANTAFVRIGAYEDNSGDISGPFAGDICEMLVFGAELSSANRQQLETHLATKWGITL